MLNSTTLMISRSYIFYLTYFFIFFNYLNREVFTQGASYLPDTFEQVLAIFRLLTDCFITALL